jgi:integrase
MAKKKKQQRPNGFLQRRGNLWSLVYGEDDLDDNGLLVRVRRRKSIGKLSEIDEVTARKLADEFLAKQNPNVRSHMLVKEFIAVYDEEHVGMLKHSGQVHYRYLLLNHVLPALGQMRLDAIDHDVVGKLLRLKLKTYSVQTVLHIRHTLSSMFKLAKLKKVYQGENPGRGHKLPEVEHGVVNALDFDQAVALLAAIKNPNANVMVRFGLETSWGKAELCGLDYQHLNLTETGKLADGLHLPPHCCLMARNYYRGVFGSAKCGNRERQTPLSSALVAALIQHKKMAQWSEPHDIVFCSSVRGVPINCRNLERRCIQPAAKAVGIPFSVSWHCFRKTFASLSESEGWELSDRVAALGHGADGRMTTHYSKKSLSRRATQVEALSTKLNQQAPDLSQEDDQLVFDFFRHIDRKICRVVG